MTPARAPLVGVVGATGAVGREAVAELRRTGAARLRLGARGGDALRELGARHAAFDTMRVDVTDPASLRAFTAGCDIVLNCAGPTYVLKEKAARAALAAGAHYVDVAGDDPVAEALGSPGGDRCVVLSAGALPGLSGLLPRHAAHDLDRVTALTAHCGGIEECTPTVAADMMLSLTTGGADGAAFGRPNAAWRDGAARPGALRPAEDATVAGFPGRVAVVPFLSTETERLARHLGAEHVDWFNVYPGPQVRLALARLPGRLAAPDAAAADLAADMMRAARLDIAGRHPWYAMAFTVDGARDGAPARRALTLRTTSSYRLTGVVAALAVDAVAHGGVTSGVHFAADVLDPGHTVRRLREIPGLFERFTMTGGDADELDEGEL
ncbi:saccharopine dehydrogenase NADP-binding domain-containing protein [Yinghuangia sp. ASG 101]|uniref:saccharopine dehydrogenase NADP-binding domain-containing protein n=1 Tax=Yinghuangia sp. ASG 101 TaxID=2896848 RepID=UPI001E5FD756|nr:saccharopine dehydrogenase NADP-binding domain-containing protein [Yinghuangia sp. ASG 101]UGQ12384.1 saccharopine dehydrogenase NADP-binding domain-containing protein [Yinghuangia sp. ASG 101]